MTKTEVNKIIKTLAAVRKELVYEKKRADYHEEMCRRADDKALGFELERDNLFKENERQKKRLDRYLTK